MNLFFLELMFAVMRVEAVTGVITMAASADTESSTSKEKEPQNSVNKNSGNKNANGADKYHCHKPLHVCKHQVYLENQ